jgi:hypothetical protein
MSLAPGTHGVVIVHGIGEQKRGDTIADFAKAICDTLINSPRESTIPTIQLKSDVSGNPPSVTCKLPPPVVRQLFGSVKKHIGMMHSRHHNLRRCCGGE